MRSAACPSCPNLSHQEWQKSLDLFIEISSRGLSASSVGHNYALSACRQGKRWRHGFEIMEVMKEPAAVFFNLRAKFHPFLRNNLKFCIWRSHDLTIDGLNVWDHPKMPNNSALGILNQELPRYYQPVFHSNGTGRALGEGLRARLPAKDGPGGPIPRP